MRRFRRRAATADYSYLIFGAEVGRFNVWHNFDEWRRRNLIGFRLTN